MSGPLARLLRRRRRPAWLVCEMCGGPYVCPIEWEPADTEHWQITTRCGQCGVWQDVCLTNDQAAVWDVQLDRQMQPIQRAAARLDGERMEAEVDAFVAALERDLIDAADFA
jgi:hypothetical protein